MALIGSQEPGGKGGVLAFLPARARAWLLDRSDRSLAQRMASTAFLIRVVSAALVYLTQVVLARWMGTFEFGIYVYVWTWVLLIGGLLDLGFCQAAQRFIPEYQERNSAHHLRGFLSGSRWIAAVAGTVIAGAAALGITFVAPALDHYLVVPLLLACLCLPFYALTGVQEGIARSYNWVNVGLMPPYIVRPALLIVFMAAAHAAGLAADATTAMLAAVAATWATAILQLLIVNRRLDRAVEGGPRSYPVRTWLSVSLPILMVESFYLLLTYTDVLVLQLFRPPTDVAHYHAASKTLALVAFVSFSVSAAVAHRFTAYHVNGDRERLAALVADSVRWTFWPSLAATVLILLLGKPLLWLFGPDFVTGYPLMFILALGLLARAAIGPIERLLNMLGEQRICAAVYAGAFALNLALCLAFVPFFGVVGAAIATSTALIIESILLFIVTKRWLGFHVFVWGQRHAVADEHRDARP